MVIILSDTFEQFAAPLIRQLGWPTLFCNRLVVENDRITGYQLRQADQKRHAVKALQGLAYQVIASGDSFNDTTMLAQADHASSLPARPRPLIREILRPSPRCTEYLGPGSCRLIREPRR